MPKHHSTRSTRSSASAPSTPSSTRTTRSILSMASPPTTSPHTRLSSTPSTPSSQDITSLIPSTRSLGQRTSSSRVSGVVALRKANEEAILDLLKRLTPSPSWPSTDCGHGEKRPKMCAGLTKNSQPNIGRWYTYCGACKSKSCTWLSPALDLQSLSENNEEYKLLLTIRESLRPMTRRRGNRSPSPSPLPTSIEFLVWPENFSYPTRISVPRPAAGAFCLNDYKVIFGEHSIERGMNMEMYYAGSQYWAAVEWDKFIYLGSTSQILLRACGVKCMCSAAMPIFLSSLPYYADISLTIAPLDLKDSSQN
ncbi:hypothetical protein NP233_g6191 [Leucocoprinus birnbaumii]|uniref:Uncharacterized protein n=1 Tax=Leucocoprinus birnbaumii TaxID=56174 RepID=A0AAD5VSP3_9AGAR|nr:hypothetical protein NP233_g6191 [Leucocoprinus birnbaumii]